MRNRAFQGLALLIAAAFVLAGCATRKPPPPVAAAPEHAVPEVYRRADADRVKALERENDRLRADLRAAEETLLAVESGMRGTQRRADAVSKLAEARIQVDRAAALAPWRADGALEAREKLDEADRQLAAGHIGSAIFFVSRASRIAAALESEADLVGKTQGLKLIKAAHANLRAEPNTQSEVLSILPAESPVFSESEQGEWALVRTLAGQVGWVHGNLLRSR